MFYVYPEVLGTFNSGLVIDTDGFRWTQRRPKDHWSYRGILAWVDQLSLDELFKLENLEFDHKPSPKFSKTITGLPEDVTPPWSLMMPRREYLTNLKRIVSSIQTSYETSSKEYYNSCWVKHRELFNSIQRLTNPDPNMFSGDDIPEVNSFKPRGSQCEKIQYNRFGTRTGRLTVSSGPQLLTLRKGMRKFLRSRWGDDGLLISIDFSALEVRLMIAELDHEVRDEDPYIDLSQSVSGSMTRESAKLALISTVYGATEHGLSGSLGVSLDKAREIHSVIQNKYGVKELIKRLRDQYMTVGYIRNKFHRRIEIPDAGDGPLLNSYLQSTGVDVSLNGFLEIIRRLPSEHAVPVGLLHDSIIIDCTREFATKIGSQLKVKIDGYFGKFPLKVSQFNC